MKEFIGVLTFCLVYAGNFGLFAQQDLAHMPGSKYYLEGRDSVMISLRPVTNREYLCYLSWLYTVQVDYPEALYEALPGFEPVRGDRSLGEGPDRSNNPFHTLVSFCSDVTGKYIFNPKYADYPLLGISYYQACKFLKWQSDRYNEFLLIYAGKLYENPGQINEDCFVTESYLCGQYVGYVNPNDPAPVMWKDRMLIPAFRLPTSSEINHAAKSGMLKTDMNLYPYQKNEVLEMFAKRLLEVSGKKIVLKNVDGFREEFKSEEDFDFSAFTIKELRLDLKDDAETATVRSVFQENGQGIYSLADFSETEKDSLGQMPFIFICEDRAKMPVVTGRYSKSVNNVADSTTLYFIRWACSVKSDRVRIK